MSVVVLTFVVAQEVSERRWGSCVWERDALNCYSLVRGSVWNMPFLDFHLLKKKLKCSKRCYYTLLQGRSFFDYHIFYTQTDLKVFPPAQQFHLNMRLPHDKVRMSLSELYFLLRKWCKILAVKQLNHTVPYWDSVVEQNYERELYIHVDCHDLL